MATETKIPDGLLTSDNLTGGLGAIDTDDSTWLVATSNNTDSVVAVSFPTPTGDPTIGAGLQNFTVKYRVTANASSVTFNAYLRESGTRLNGGAAIDTWASTSTTEVTREITWDATLLGTSDGSLVELEVVATKVGGGPSVRTTGEFQFIDWDVDFSTATNIASTGIDISVDIGDSAIAAAVHMITLGIGAQSDIEHLTLFGLSANPSDTLTINDALHAHTADNIVLSQVHNLLIDEAGHAHEADNLVLSQVHGLIIDEASHSHEADNLVLSQVHNLIISDGAHDHSADNLVLSQVHPLVVNDSNHAHIADNLLLSQVHGLVINSSGHGVSSDNVTLSQVHGLVIGDSTHTLTSDELLLSQIHNLVIQNTTHGLTSDQLNLFVPPTEPPSLKRTLILEGETKELVLAGEGRTLILPTEKRTLGI